MRLLFMLLFLPALASTQIYQPVFPGQTGQTLLNNLVASYKPGTVLDWTQSRDTLFSRVLAINDDSVRCIYSGHTLYLDPSADPTQYVYLNGSSLGMNTEHAYPQSKGASDGNARSDMNHLYATRSPVNEARADNPFADVPDAQTDRWFRNTFVVNTPPAQNRDAWSESNDGIAFEPREEVKGDIARSVFYFYTMYNNEANAADLLFFGLQRATLCQWHEADPADSAELTRTLRIAPYQDGKANPFILDCTVAYRGYCPELTSACATTSASEPASPALGAMVYPMPFNGTGTLNLNLPFAGSVQGRWLTVYGQELQKFELQNAPEGRVQIPLDAANLPVSMYFLEIVLENNGKKIRQVVRVL